MLTNHKTTYNRILLTPPETQAETLDYPTYKPCEPIENCILILDDDAHFREIVSQLLQSNGYCAIEARSAQEAFECLETNIPAAAIVDYRLPGMDGITWITKIRERGIRIPIIFISGVWCDKRTFDWLRNILKVSLIMQKPIVPELFLSSIEDVLPPRRISSSSSSGTENKSISVDYTELINRQQPQEALKSIDQLLTNKDLNETARSEMNRIKKVLTTQIALGKARRAYEQQIPGIWATFLETLLRLEKEPQNKEVLDDIRLGIHRIKGTSGSYGLIELSSQAERLENLLNSIDQSCQSEQLIVFQEVLEQALAISTSLQHKGESDATKDPANSFSLLVVSPDATLVTNSCPGSRLPVHLEHVTSAIGALQRCKQKNFDGVLIDLSVENASDGYFQLARRLRSLPNRSSLPLAYILEQHQAITDAELIFTGCSACIERQSDSVYLDTTLEQLQYDSDLHKARILCVDDDPLATSYLSSLLQAEGYATRCLNDPILVLDAMEEFQPTIVILDVMMPGLSGFDVCRMIRTHEGFSHCRIIMLTVRNDAHSRNLAFAAGADEFLVKPMVGAEVLARVKTQLLTIEKTDRLVLPELNSTQFIEEARRLRLLCAKENVTLVAISATIREFADLDTQYGIFAAEDVANRLCTIVCSRFRPCDLRARKSSSELLIIMPGISECTASEAGKCLVTEWYDQWFTGARGDRFQTPLTTSTFEIGPDCEQFEKLLNQQQIGIDKGKLLTHYAANSVS